MKVIIRSKTFNITSQEVKDKLKAVKPEVEGKARYYIQIGGKQFPVKQVLGQTLNLPKAGFTTQDAYNILERLDFEITRRK